MPHTDDYPAAHSMDSSWYAVDEDGAVAWFETGEGGAVPQEGFAMGGEAGTDDPLEESELFAAALVIRSASVQGLDAFQRGDDSLLEAFREGLFSLDGDDRIALARWLGIYAYDCPEAVATPYVRHGPVPDPLRVDAWPPQLRRRLMQGKLPLRFAATPLIAPGEYTDVYTWGTGWLDTRGTAHSSEESRPLEPEEFEEYGPEDIEAFRDGADDVPMPEDHAMVALVWTAVETGRKMNPQSAVPPDADPSPSDGSSPVSSSVGQRFFDWLKRRFR